LKIFGGIFSINLRGAFCVALAVALLVNVAVADGFSDGGWGEPRRSNRRDDWDDTLMRQRAQVATETMNYIGINSPGEWNWWDPSEDVKYQFIREFWDPNIDYIHFERLTQREVLDRQNLIRKDTRSCPMDDTEECRRWQAIPRRIEALPRARGFNEEPEREQTFGHAAASELFSNREARRQALAAEGWQPMLVDNIWSAHPKFQFCPFETEKECQIWLDKPIVRETMANRNVRLPSVDKLIVLIRAGNRITSDMDAAHPLVNRYRMLQSAARACCTSGLVHSMQSGGASQGLVYQFLVDDANFYQFGERCLMVTDYELDYHPFELAVAVADVRNTCLCRNRDYFESLLGPFVEVYRASPGFADEPFFWSFRDGLNRDVAVSINQEIRAVLWQMRQCPDQ